MVENALRDPASLQRLLSNPMIAQMARANPQLIEEALGNPEVQQALQQHPEMRGQIEQLLGRPLPAALAPPAAAAPVLTAPATQTFEAQLTQLAEMGFHDRSACIAALQTSGRAKAGIHMARAHKAIGRNSRKSEASLIYV